MLTLFNSNKNSHCLIIRYRSNQLILFEAVDYSVEFLNSFGFIKNSYTSFMINNIGSQNIRL